MTYTNKDLPAVSYETKRGVRFVSIGERVKGRIHKNEMYSISDFVDDIMSSVTFKKKNGLWNRMFNPDELHLTEDQFHDMRFRIAGKIHNMVDLDTPAKSKKTKTKASKKVKKKK